MAVMLACLQTPPSTLRPHKRPRRLAGCRRFSRNGVRAAPKPRLSPGSEHVACLLDGGDDLAYILDRALDKEVDARRLAARAADVGEESDYALLRRIRPHERMEHPDLAS